MFKSNHEKTVSKYVDHYFITKVFSYLKYEGTYTALINKINS